MFSEVRTCIHQTQSNQLYPQMHKSYDYDKSHRPVAFFHFTYIVTCAPFLYRLTCKNRTRCLHLMLGKK